jgi:hypothetical protein
VNVYDAMAAVEAKGATITGVQWTNEPTTGHGYAIADFGGSVGQRSGVDVRFDFSIRCCGFTKDQTINTLKLVRDAFADWRPWPSTRPDVKAEELDCGPLLSSTSVPGDLRWSSTLLIRIET